jgi:hypothetical protein
MGSIWRNYFIHCIHLPDGSVRTLVKSRLTTDVSTLVELDVVEVQSGTLAGQYQHTTNPNNNMDIQRILTT